MTFLDTNVILRYLTWDEPKKARRCEDLFKKAVDGKEVLCITTLVIAEVIWTLEKAYKLPKSEIVTHVQRILNTPNIELDEKDILLTAIGLYGLKKIDFIDAYNAISMETKGIDSVYSYDTHFDLIPPLTRLEP
ncbi:MAG: PIN domain-containing protein [Candidatus Omnitrophica bacterium]|nr:PIN domain-containing protein [Candidatus Omnitrophota bacterium]MBU4590836.1 PIN domain-containing protein [Candidatus Omnitrophota bacterium]